MLLLIRVGRSPCLKSYRSFCKDFKAVNDALDIRKVLLECIGQVSPQCFSVLPGDKGSKIIVHSFNPRMKHP